MSRTDTDSETTVSSKTDSTTEVSTAETAPKTAPESETDSAKTDAAKTAVLDTDSAKTEQASTDQAKPDKQRSLVVPIILAVLVVALAVVVGVLGWKALSERNAQQDRDAALAAARTDVAQVLSYDAKNIEADVARSRKVVSGDFAAKFEELANTVIVPAGKQQGLSTKAEVMRSALMDAGPDTPADQAQVLLFVKQTSTTTATPDPRSGVNQLKATMTKSNGQWLVSNLEPL